MNSNCIFCKIINEEIESATIFENSEFKVILDKFPSSKGHTLIMPKEHVQDVFDLDSETVSKLYALGAHIAKVLKRKLNCDGMNFLQNNGAAAGQTVNHFHLHLIPRYENDNVNINWKVKELTENELDEFAKEIGKDI